MRTIGATAPKQRFPPAVAWEILRTSLIKGKVPPLPRGPAASSRESSSVAAVATPLQSTRDHQLAFERPQLIQPTPKSELQASRGRVTDIGSDLDLEVVKRESLRRPPSSLDQYSSEATSSHRVLSSPSAVDTDSEGTVARTAGFFDGRPTSTSTSRFGVCQPAGIETQTLGPGLSSWSSSNSRAQATTQLEKTEWIFFDRGRVFSKPNKGLDERIHDYKQKSLDLLQAVRDPDLEALDPPTRNIKVGPIWRHIYSNSRSLISCLQAQRSNQRNATGDCDAEVEANIIWAESCLWDSERYFRSCGFSFNVRLPEDEDYDSSDEDTDSNECESEESDLEEEDHDSSDRVSDSEFDYGQTARTETSRTWCTTTP